MKMEKMIDFASCSLAKKVRSYVQIEKEALGTIYGAETNYIDDVDPTNFEPRWKVTTNQSVWI